MFRKIMFMCVVMVLMVGFTAGSQGDDAGNFNQEKSTFSKNFQDKLSQSVALFVGSSDAVVNNVDRKIEEGAQRVVPYVKQGRTLVPLRFIAEAFGAQVNWIPEFRRVTIQIDDKTMALIIDEKNLLIKDKGLEQNILLDVAAEIYENRTFVPLRQLVEAMGKNVFWSDGLIIISDSESFDETKQEVDLSNLVQKLNPLPSVGNIQNLKNILQDVYEKDAQNMYSIDAESMVDDALEMSAPNLATVDASQAFGNQSQMNDRSNATKMSKDTTGSFSSEQALAVEGIEESPSASEYSKTNVQVEGVDEGDIVKTDGEFIYKVNNREIIIAKAYPAEKMEVVHKIDVTEENVNAQPIEIFVDNNQLIVISHMFYAFHERIQPIGFHDERIAIMPPFTQKNYTKVSVYDIRDKKNPIAMKKFEIEGRYLSSRKINTDFYLISNKTLDVYNVLNQSDEMTLNDYSIQYKDSAISNKYETIQLEDIRYFPKSLQTNYLNVVGMDLKSPETPANVSTFLGAGQAIYASDRSLYVALSSYAFSNSPNRAITSGRRMIEPAWMPPQQRTEETKIYQFALNSGNITFMHEGSVPGHILNQFSMDEWQNHFRIATTLNNFMNPAFNRSNNLYVFDDTLKRVGEIENIAPGETIYSVRFMGNRAYMVTFKTVDPLFVIDLKTPEEPKILGQLKIPGFSNYLHPYDENHIIGFGKDATEYKDIAIEKGLKIALFDVSDVENPIEKFVEIIGDRGTRSEVLNNHRALLFSKERELLAFPVSLYTIQPTKFQKVDPRWEYGTFVYQGLYVYNFNLEDGFQLRGRITHFEDKKQLDAPARANDEDEENVAPALNIYDLYNYRYNQVVERALYIDDVLYTMSENKIQANNLNSLKKMNELVINN